MARKSAASKATPKTSSLLGLSTEELSRELQKRQRALPGLYTKLAKAEAKVKRIMTAIQSLGGGVDRAVAASGRRKGSVVGRKRPKNDMNLVESLAKVLKGKTMGVTEVTQAVQVAGYKTSAANFRTIVNQALIRSEAFKKVSRGQYTAK
jgi:hypothetical protein